jgi:hypothetical protein
MQGPGAVSFLWWSANGRYGRTSCRSRASRSAHAPVGSHASVSAPLCLRVGRPTHKRGAARFHARLIRRPAPARPAVPRCAERPLWSHHFHSAIRFRAKSE